MEIEFKFHIPPERLAALEAELHQGPVQRTRLQARYFDTPGSALARAGMALRLRQEGERWVQTVKAAGHGLLHRLEHNAPLDDADTADDGTLQPDLQRHADTEVGERLARVLAEAGEPLVQTYATDIWRLTRELRQDGATVELALDQGRILAADPGGGAPREVAVCELELELLDGPLPGLVTLARAWAQRHGLWLGTVSKAERGERLMRGIDHVPAVNARPPRFDGAGSPDGAEVQRRVLAACLAQVLPNASEIAEGSEDEDQIHQLRVGLRRLRTALRELAPLAPGFDAAWQAPLTATFRALGAERDRTQVMAQSREWLAGTGAPPVRLPPAPDAPTPAQAVRDPAFQGVLVALVGHAAGGPELGRPAIAQAGHGAEGQADGTPEADTARPAGAGGADKADEAHDDPSDERADPPAPLDADATQAHLRHRLRRLHRQSLRDAGRFDTLDDEQRHATRKRLKRLRYLAEFVAPLLDEARTGRYLARLRPVQDVLGLFNDQATARRLYEQAAEQDAHAWFAVGWIAAQQPRTAKKAGQALRRLEDAPKFWKRRRKA